MSFLNIKAPPRPVQPEFEVVADYTLLEADAAIVEDNIPIDLSQLPEDQRPTLPWIELDDERLRSVLALRDV